MVVVVVFRLVSITSKPSSVVNAREDSSVVVSIFGCASIPSNVHAINWGSVTSGDGSNCSKSSISFVYEVVVFRISDSCVVVSVVVVVSSSSTASAAAKSSGSCVTTTTKVGNFKTETNV